MTKLLVSGAAGGMFPNMLLRAASVYDTPYEALSEYLQNSTDEVETTTVWVLLNQSNDHIQITDDGPGMGGPLSEFHSGLIDLYYDEIAKKFDKSNKSERLDKSEKDEIGYDLRSLIGEAGTRTLEWFVRNVGYSAKGDIKQSEGGHKNSRITKYMKNAEVKSEKRRKRATMGMYGIGAWAFLSFAESMAVTTRPKVELAKQLDLDTENVPTFIMTLPSRTDIGNFQIGYELLEVEDDTLKDPYGNELPHGTQIDITGINESVWDSLTFESVLSYLTSTYGNRISQTGLKIFVMDGSTGRVEKVKPRPIQGEVLLETTIKSQDGTDCDMFIYYNRRGRGLEPMVTKYNIPICNLSTIKGKNNQPVFGSPWNCGRLDGWIAFEHHQSGDDHLYGSSKHTLADTSERRFWISEVKKHEAYIARRIEEIERMAADERLSKASDLNNLALAKALSKQGISFAIDSDEDGNENDEKTGSPSDKVRNPRQHKDLKNIIVSVVDRGNRGVAGIKVIVKGPHKTWEKETGVSGTTQFGSPIPGPYKVSIVTKLPIISQDVVTFDIDHKKGQFGRRVKFIVNTGEPVQKIQAPATAFITWDDPDEPWRQSILSFGLIELNMNSYTKLSSLMGPHGNAELAKALTAEYMTAAVFEALKETGEHPSRLRQSNFYYDVLAYLHELEIEALQSEKKLKKRGRPSNDDLQKTG